MKKEIPWINTMKALCMLGVYFLHSLEYSGGNQNLVTTIVSSFYVNGFFVISGLLFFKKWLNIKEVNLGNQLHISFLNVLFRIVIPTLLFSSIFYLPKLIFHERDVSLIHYLYDVWGGISYWFTSALSVSQLILLFFIFIGIKSLKSLLYIVIILIPLIFLLKHIDTSPFPWYYKSGLGGVIFMILGGLVYKYFDSIINILKRFKYLIFCVFLIMSFLQNKYYYGEYVLMSVRFNIYGSIYTCLGIMLIILISMRIPSIHFLQTIGKNSILFYFMSGVIPAIISTLFLKYFTSPWLYLFVTVISVIIGYFTSLLIKKYLPGLVDLRKMRIKFLQCRFISNK